MGAFESGQTFLAGVLAKLPDASRAQVQEIFNLAEARDAVTLVGDGALARTDYSRSMDQLREKEQALTEHYERLNTWYDVNKSALEEAKALKTAALAPTTGNGNGTGTGTTGTTGVITPSTATPTAFTAEEARRIADQAINDAGRDYIAVSAFIASIAARHQAMFGEPLDALEIVQNPKVGKPVTGQPGRIFSLQDAYQERYGEKVAAKAKEAEEKRFNDEVERRLSERTKSQSTHPFPLRNESSPLDVLQTKEGPAAHTIDTAVAEYERLQAARGG